MMYLLHNGETEQATEWLQAYKDKGKIMDREEYITYVKLMVYEIYLCHKQYKEALQFINKDTRLEPVVRTVRLLAPAFHFHCFP